MKPDHSSGINATTLNVEGVDYIKTFIPVAIIREFQQKKLACVRCT